MRNAKAEIIIFAIASAALLCAAYFVLWQLGVFGGLGFHGTIAAIIGITLTSVLAIVLMGLIFFSKNSGYDEEVDEATRKPPRRF